MKIAKRNNGAARLKEPADDAKGLGRQTWQGEFMQAIANGAQVFDV